MKSLGGRRLIFAFAKMQRQVRLPSVPTDTYGKPKSVVTGRRSLAVLNCKEALLSAISTAVSKLEI